MPSLIRSAPSPTTARHCAAKARTSCPHNKGRPDSKLPTPQKPGPDRRRWHAGPIRRSRSHECDIVRPVVFSNFGWSAVIFEGSACPAMGLRARRARAPALRARGPCESETRPATPSHLPCATPSSFLLEGKGTSITSPIIAGISGATDVTDRARSPAMRVRTSNAVVSSWTVYAR